jgi:phosphopantetheinyl transferase
MSPRGDCLVRYARLDDCLAAADLRAPHFGDEARQFDRIADATRRRQWLAGRALARELLRESFGFADGNDVQIISRSENGLGMRPLVVADGCQLDCRLSISHTSRGVLVALAPQSECPIGVDLCDELDSFSPGFLRLWFTPAEQSWIDGDRRRAATIWAIKEAVFKAISQGAPWNPRELEVHPANDDCVPATAAAAMPASFRCLYRGQVVQPLSLALRGIDGHTAAIACLALNAAIRFSVPIRSSRALELQSTSCDSVTTDRCDVDQIQAAASVPPVGHSPCWIST